MKKNIQELALNSVDVSAITGTYITDYMLNARSKQSVFDQLFSIISLPQGHATALTPSSPTSNIKIINGVSAGNTIEDSTYCFNANTVQTNKTGCFIPITFEAFEQSNKAVLDRLLSDVSKKLYENFDLQSQTVALDLKLGTITSFEDGTLGLGSAPVVEVISVSVGSESLQTVDYYNAKFLLSGSIEAGTIVYSYSNLCSTVGNGLIVNAASPTSLSLDDIQCLRNLMIDKTVHPDFVLINTKSLRNLSKDTEFQSFFVATKDNVYNGEIGSVLDMSVLASDIVPSGVAVLVDSSRLGYNIISRDIEATLSEKLEFDEKHLHIWTEQQYILGDTMAIGLVCNIASDAGVIQ